MTFVSFGFHLQPTPTCLRKKAMLLLLLLFIKQSNKPGSKFRTSWPCYVLSFNRKLLHSKSLAYYYNPVLSSKKTCKADQKVQILRTTRFLLQASLHRVLLETNFFLMEVSLPSRCLYLLKRCWPVTYLRKESPSVSNDSSENSSWHSFVVSASKICI